MGEKMKSRDCYRKQARLLKALANETRLMMIDKLKEGERTVNELVELAGLDQSTVSKHLSVLRNEGIVEDRKQGNFVYYKLVTTCVMDFFACATQVMKSRS